jgi:YggT family protein
MIPTSPLVTATVLLIETLFGVYILLVMLRFLLQWLKISFRGEPILQLVLRATNPPLLLLYNFIPGWRGIDFAAILLMMVLKVFQILLTLWLYGKTIGFFALLVLALAKLIYLLINVFFFSVLIEVILSWVTPPNSYNPIVNILYRLNEPLLRPVRKKIPPVQGIDFSPLVVIIGLQLANIIIVGYLEQLAGVL